MGPQEIDEAFDMVLIADRFAESVVLLREALCWSHGDVSYLKLNARQQGGKRSRVASKVLSTTIKTHFRLFSTKYGKFRSNIQIFDYSI